jgi:hypothetical protein
MGVNISIEREVVFPHLVIDRTDKTPGMNCEWFSVNGALRLCDGLEISSQKEGAEDRGFHRYPGCRVETGSTALGLGHRRRSPNTDYVRFSSDQQQPISFHGCWHSRCGLGAGSGVVRAQEASFGHHLTVYHIPLIRG